MPIDSNLIKNKSAMKLLKKYGGTDEQYAELLIVIGMTGLNRSKTFIDCLTRMAKKKGKKNV